MVTFDAEVYLRRLGERLLDDPDQQQPGYRSALRGAAAALDIKGGRLKFRRELVAETGVAVVSGGRDVGLDREHVTPAAGEKRAELNQLAAVGIECA